MKHILPFVLFTFLVLQVFGQKIPFQGKLIEDGSPVNDSKTIEFGLPDLGWSEIHSNVPVTDGLYFVVLGSINPLPANLFSGADERQLNLSVNGTALSPVTLYKPLASELSEINLKGPGNGLLQAAFRTGSDLHANRPFLSMRGNLEGERLSFNVNGNTDGTVESSSVFLNSTTGFNSNLVPGRLFLYNTTPNAAMMSNDELWFRTGNVYNLQLFNQNWGEKGYGGTILLRGPNSMNLVIGNKHWENSDLPWFSMSGSQNNSVVELSAINDEHESGYINLNSKNGYHSSLSAGNLFVFGQNNKKSGISHEQITLWNENWERGVSIRSSNHGDPRLQGLIELFGANSPDPYKRTGVLSTADWGNGDFGIMELFGSHSRVTMIDQDNSHKISLRVENKSGHLSMGGPNSDNWYIGTMYNNADRASMSLKGANGNNMIDFYIMQFNNDPEYGELYVRSGDGSFTNLRPNGLSSSGTFYIGNSAHVEGNLHVTGNITYNGAISPSDKRLKKDINPIEKNVLDKIHYLGSYSYFWRQDEFPDKYFTADQQIGLMAQELEEQFPALVKTGGDGFKSVNYNGFTAVLLEAVKELNDKVEKLESENRLLQAELSASAIKSAELEDIKSQVDILVKMVQGKSVSSDESATAESALNNIVK
jgi:hypothetical protein